MNIISTRARITMLALAILSVVALTAPTTATAQCCPTYPVSVGNTLPTTCFPLTVTTTWSNGLSGTTVHTAPGVIILPAPNPPGCWVPPLTGLVINGVVIPLPTVLPPCLPPVNIGCAVINVCFLSTATGCIGILIS